jgi:hypothetical protein
MQNETTLKLSLRANTINQGWPTSTHREATLYVTDSPEGNTNTYIKNRGVGRREI